MKELFICNLLTVYYYSEHYHAYLAETTPEFVFLQRKDLLDCHPLNLVTPPGTSQSFVPLKYQKVVYVYVKMIIMTTL